MLLTLILFPFFVLFARSQNHRVVIGPEPSTAPLGTNATFHCVVENGQLRWRINNLNIPLNADGIWETAAKPVNGFFRGEFWSNSTTSVATLLISATIRNNRTVNISCSAFAGLNLPAHNSPNVQLTVFGLPLAPGDVEVIGERVGQLRLSWVAPYTLPGETVSYSVLVQNLNDTTDNVSINTSTPVYSHQISENLVLSCHLFIYSVFSINEVGSSINSSSTEPLLHPSVPKLIKITDARVAFGNVLTIILTLEIPEMCIPIILSVAVKGENGAAIKCPVIRNGSSATITGSDCGVRENEKYSIVVQAENKFNLSSISSSTTIYTTDVQWARAVELSNHSLLLSCGYAEGSDAKGCQLTIIPSHTGKIWIVVRLLRNESGELETNELYEGSVEWGVGPSLLVSDIEKDGTTSSIQVSGKIILISPILPSPDHTISDNSELKAAPTILQPPASHSKNDDDGRERIMVVAVLAAIVGIILVLAIFTIICLKRTRSKKTARDSNAEKNHIYEDVDLIANPRYLSHKLETYSKDQTPCVDAINPLQISPTTGVYSYPSVPGPEFDAYEVMKPTDPVKTATSLTTTDNVCYSTV